MKKVLTLVNNLDVGGIEKTLLSCIPGLNNQSIKISILCFQEGGRLEEEYKEHGIEILTFNKKKSPFGNAVELYQILKSRDYDIVHSRFGFTSGLFAMVCFLSKKPFFVSLHSVKYLGDSKRENSSFFKVYLLAQKLLTKFFATKIIGHSITNLDHYTAYWRRKNKYSLIYNGIDFHKLRSNSRKSEKLRNFVEGADITILHIGSFRRAKNHDLLIDSFYGLNPIQNNYKLLLVGDGPLMKDIRAKVRNKGLDNHVHFAGIDTDIPKYFENSDLLFFPSIYEGFGNVLLEAQFMQTPICASNIPAHYEASYHFYHQFFFNPTDIQEATKQLESLISRVKTGELDDAVGEAKDFIMQSFSIDKMTRKLKDLYRSY